uniref:Small cardioactive peptide 2 n=1 Tax=Deroceras reticulatum TaxID=145610 RepID=A0A1X9WEF9_DERRE|nr:small cardioactive peptide 2 [Deroceras reticulatum]
MELTLQRASFSVTVLVLVICSAEALNYLAFPRMGRSGYLAFPRMGRGQVKSETGADIGSCCGLGLRSEFLIGQDGKEELRVLCPANMGCCEGLREVVDEKADGVFYSICVPVQQESNTHESDVLRKVKSLIRK